MIVVGCLKVQSCAVELMKTTSTWCWVYVQLFLTHTYNFFTSHHYHLLWLFSNPIGTLFGTSHVRKMQHILRMTGRPPSFFLLSPLNPWPHKHIHTLAGNRVDNGRGLNAPAHQGSSFHVIKFQTHDFGSMECQFVLYCISLPSIMIHDRAEWHPNMRGRIPSLKRQRRCQVSKSQVAQIMFLSSLLLLYPRSLHCGRLG